MSREKAWKISWNSGDKHWNLEGPGSVEIRRSISSVSLVWLEEGRLGWCDFRWEDCSSN